MSTRQCERVRAQHVVAYRTYLGGLLRGGLLRGGNGGGNGGGNAGGNGIALFSVNRYFMFSFQMPHDGPLARDVILDKTLVRGFRGIKTHPFVYFGVQ